MFSNVLGALIVVLVCFALKCSLVFNDCLYSLKIYPSLYVQQITLFKLTFS